MKKFFAILLCFCIFPGLWADGKSSGKESSDWVSTLTGTISKAWSDRPEKAAGVNKIISEFSRTGDFSEDAQSKLYSDLSSAGVQDLNCLAQLVNISCAATGASANKIMYSNLCNALSQENLACAVNDILSDHPDENYEARTALREYIDARNSGSVSPQALAEKLKDCGIQDESSVKQLVSVANQLAVEGGKDNFSSIAKTLDNVKQTEFTLQFKDFLTDAYADKGDAVRDALEQFMNGDVHGEEKQKELKQTLMANGLDENAANILQQTAIKLADGSCSRNDLDQARYNAIPEEYRKQIEQNPDAQKNLDELQKKIAENNKESSTADSAEKSDGILTQTILQFNNLKDKISSSLPEDLASRINQGISDFINKADFSDIAIQALMKELQKAGITDENAQKTVQTVLKKILQGNAEYGDITEVAAAVGRNLIANRINELNLSENVRQQLISILSSGNADISMLKDLSLEAVAALLAEHGVPQDQIDPLLKILDSYLDNWGQTDWDKVISDIKTITAKQIANVLTKQLERLTEKYPFLGSFLNALGINGASLENYLAKLTWKDVKAAFEKIINMNWESLKSGLVSLAGKMIGVLTNMAVEVIEKYINMAMEKLSALITKLLDGNALKRFLAKQINAKAATLQSEITSELQDAVRKTGRKWQYLLQE